MSAVPNIRILAFDQSPTSTGYAIGEPLYKGLKYGLIKLGSWFEKEGDRLIEFYDTIEPWMKRENITHVYYEDGIGFAPGEKSYQVDEWQKMLIGQIEVAATRNRIPTFKTNINQMRKRFIATSKGPRDWLKQQAINRCRRIGLYDVNDDNVAEAIGHLDFGLSQQNKQHAGKSDLIFHQVDLDRAIKKFRGELDVGT